MSPGEAYLSVRRTILRKSLHSIVLRIRAHSSSPDPYEHLMIIYFDILLLDDRSLLGLCHSERFRLLKTLIRCNKGQSELVQNHVLDFRQSSAVSDLRNLFAKTIVGRREGLVLKPDVPYFNFHHRGPFTSRCIKLKKEYIGGFGDVGDFAVVGAGYCAAKAKSSHLPNIKWTHFYLGCLNNSEEVRRWHSRPEFSVVSVVELNDTQLKALRQYCNPDPVAVEKNSATIIIPAERSGSAPALTIAFQNPPVFDLRCFSFTKPSNGNFWVPRFPVVSKIHFDRDFRDATSFQELQYLAEDAVEAPQVEDSQELLAWIAKLEGADPRGWAVDAATQITHTTASTPSPISPTQSTEGLTPRPSPVVSDGTEVARLNVNVTRRETLEVVTSPNETWSTSRSDSFSRPEVLHRRSMAQVRRKRSLSTLARSSADAENDQPSNQKSSSSSSQLGQRRIRTPLARLPGNLSGSVAPQRTAYPTTVRAVGQRDTGLAGDREEIKDVDSGQLLIASAAACRRRTNAPARSSRRRMSSPQSGFPAQEVVVDCHQVRRRASSFWQQQDPTWDASVPHRSNRSVRRSPSEHSLCAYSSSTCALSHCLILYPSTNSCAFAELAGLLITHGVDAASMSVQAWLDEKEGTPKRVRTSSKVGGRIILLVESFGSSPETKATMAKVREVLRSVPRTERDRVAMYDWRVLRHLTKLEDATIASKYYDGFRNPWQRWFCGEI